MPAGRRRWQGRAGWLLLLFSAAAQSQFTEMPGHPYREVVDRRLPTSGEASVIGMSLVGGDYGRELHVFLADPLPSAQLRVDVETPDGSFHGTGLFSGSTSVPGWVTLTLLSKERVSQKPAGLRPEEVAVAVRLVAAPGTVPRLLLAAWKRADPSSAVLRVQVNSRRARTFVRGSASAQPAECQRVQSASRRLFDFVCDIRVADLDVIGGKRRLTLLRSDGFAVEPQHVDVAL